MHKYIRPWRAECRGAYVHSAQLKSSRALHQTVLACGSWAAGRQPASNKHLYMLPAPLPAPYTALAGATLLLPLPPTKRGSASRARHLSRRTVAPPGAFAFNSSRLALFSPSFLVQIYRQGAHRGERRGAVGREAGISVPPRSRYRRRAPRTQAMPGRDPPACRAAACRVVPAWRAVRGLWAPGARSPAAARSRSLAPDWAVGRSCYEPTPQTGGAPSVP